jgi:hypothetical protein
MGGLNSGSIRRSSRLRDSELHRLAVRDIGDVLQGDKRIEWKALVLITSADRETRFHLARRHVEIQQHPLLDPAISIELATSTPTFGGTRYWFLCPSGRCGRRCSVLYREQRTNVRAFRCRHCLRLRYESQVLGDADAIAHRLFGVLGRLALLPEGVVARPRHMHRTTFERLRRQLSSLVAAYRAADPLARHCARIPLPSATNNF